MDIYTDSVVCKPSFPGYKVAQTALLVLAVLALLLSVVNNVFLIATAVFGLGAFLIWHNTEVEYEYTHTNSTLDIDKVTHNSRRKALLTIDLNHVLQVSPMEETRGLSRMKQYNFTGDGDGKYAMICTVKGEKAAVLLQLDNRMLTSLKRQIPEKFM